MRLDDIRRRVDHHEYAARLTPTIVHLLGLVDRAVPIMDELNGLVEDEWGETVPEADDWLRDVRGEETPS